MKFIIIATLTLPFTLALANICQNYFLINYNRQNLSTFYTGNQNRINWYNENIQSSSGYPERQMALIREQFHFQLRLFSMRKSYHETTKKALKLKELGDPQIYLKYLSDKEDKLVKRFIPQVESLTQTLSKVLEQNGIPHKLAPQKITKDDVVYHRIELQPNEMHDKKSLAILQKYQEMFDIEVFSIDLLRNIKNGSLGFRFQDIIDIGLNGARNIILQDILLLVTKHEAKHASFAKQRTLGIPSAFHTSFIANGMDNLSTVKNAGYERYMSAEELHNFVNNAYWASSKLKNANDYSVDELLFHFQQMYSNVRSSKLIGFQTKSLVNQFQHLTNKILKEEVHKGNFSPLFLDSQLRSVNTIEEITSFAIQNPETGHIALFYVEPKLKPAITKLLEARAKLTAEVNAEISVKGPPSTEREAQAFYRNFQEREAELTSKEQEAILNNALKQLGFLDEAADRALAKQPNIISRFEKFIKEVKQESRSQNPFSDKEYWNDKFFEQVQHAREYANTVRGL